MKYWPDDGLGFSASSCTPLLILAQHFDDDLYFPHYQIAARVNSCHTGHPWFERTKPKDKRMEEALLYSNSLKLTKFLSSLEARKSFSTCYYVLVISNRPLHQHELFRRLRKKRIFAVERKLWHASSIFGISVCNNRERGKKPTKGSAPFTALASPQNQ